MPAQCAPPSRASRNAAPIWVVNASGTGARARSSCVARVAAHTTVALEVPIDPHGDRTHEKLAARGDRDAFVAQFDQSRFGQISHAGQFALEIAVEVDAVRSCD